MRILLINNYFREGGGVERVFFIERELLTVAGHTVIDFSTAHPDNHPSHFSKFFVTGLDFQRRGQWLKKAARFFYSYEVAHKLSRLIQATRPEVVHIHGIYDVLGPTVLRVLTRYKIPTVFTAHAYKLICPNWKLFARGAVDEGCKKNWWHDIFNRSVQNSFWKSLGSALSWWWQKTGQWWNVFSVIISPSQFLLDKHVQFGWPRERFVYLPNPLDITKYSVATEEKNFVLFVGRLVPEKGVEILLRAAALMPTVTVQIVGSGPEFSALKKLATDLKLYNVIFVGALPMRDVITYVRAAQAVVVPSLWYENDSYAVLEAQAEGKVVIASHIGGLPEQIKQGQTGFLCTPGDPLALAETIQHVLALPASERLAIGRAARARVDVVRNPELYLENLLEIFLKLAKNDR